MVIREKKEDGCCGKQPAASSSGVSSSMKTYAQMASFPWKEMLSPPRKQSSQGPGGEGKVSSTEGQDNDCPSLRPEAVELETVSHNLELEATMALRLSEGWGGGTGLGHTPGAFCTSGWWH